MTNEGIHMTSKTGEWEHYLSKLDYLADGCFMTTQNLAIEPNTDNSHKLSRRCNGSHRHEWDLLWARSPIHE